MQFDKDTTFAKTLEKYGSKIAISIAGAEGCSVTYDQLAALADKFAINLKEGDLLLIKTRNQLDPLVAYLGALRANRPVLLAPTLNDSLLKSIITSYQPTVIYESRDGQWVCERQHQTAKTMHPDLALLLSTSGSTGSPKLVRLSHQNLQSNADSIAEYLGIDDSHRAITSLPFYYSYGLSVVNSHLARGARLLLTDKSVLETEFWQLFETQQATSLAGVPYTYELLEQAGLSEKQLPSLKYLTQAGGKLPQTMVTRFAQLAETKGWRFFVMYGQTEATARISYMPPDKLKQYPDCIGIPIPGGTIELYDESEQLISAADSPGQLTYRGNNVMMGYAEGINDLELGPMLDALKTGDIACRNEAGLFYIVGRSSRFIKPFGLRINLDDVEHFLRARNINAIAGGSDDQLVVLAKEQAQGVLAMIAEHFELSAQAITVKKVDKFPLLNTGKYDYSDLRKMAEDAKQGRHQTTSSVAEIFAHAFPTSNITTQDSFVTLGGSSLSYIGVSAKLENHLGGLPANWETTSIAELEQVKPKPTAGMWQLSKIDSDIFLRACAIMFVVAVHSATLPFLFGGTQVLFLLAGFSFAKFRAPDLCQGQAISKTIRSVVGLVLPYMAIVGGYQLLKFNFDPAILFLYGLYTSDITGLIAPLWFMQALIHIILVMGLLYYAVKVKQYLKDQPFFSFITLLILCQLLGTILPDDALWLTRLANLLSIFSIFCAGAAMFFAKSSWQKIIVLIILCGLAILLAGSTSRKIWLLASGMLLLWLPSVSIPRLTKAGILIVGQAAFYIYLTHLFFIHPFRHILHIELFIVNFSAGLLGGVLCWKFYELTKGMLLTRHGWKNTAQK